jgi:hypothetical protein
MLGLGGWREESRLVGDYLVFGEMGVSSNLVRRDERDMEIRLHPGAFSIWGGSTWL